MRSVGKIDREIYKCITEDIRTDEVIITEERIDHIIERRGTSFYDTYSNEFSFILNNPDYIFKNKPYTALVCKYLKSEDKYINIVLRIVGSIDNPAYKNSILTVIIENPKRFQQRLRSNKPAYIKNFACE